MEVWDSVSPSHHEYGQCGQCQQCGQYQRCPQRPQRPQRPQYPQCAMSTASAISTMPLVSTHTHRGTHTHTHTQPPSPENPKTHPFWAPGAPRGPQGPLPDNLDSSRPVYPHAHTPRYHKTTFSIIFRPLFDHFCQNKRPGPKSQLF